MDTPIRIAIVDPHDFVRDGLKLLLELSPKILLVGEGQTALEALPLCGRTNPDVLLIDFASRDELAMIEPLCKLYTQLKVLVLTVNMEAEYVLLAVKMGVSGYVFKSLGGDELEEAICAVYSGQQVFDDEAAKYLTAAV